MSVLLIFSPRENQNGRDPKDWPMNDQLADIGVVIERMRRIDPGAFEMIIGSDGLSTGFINSDRSRRSTAYLAACTELKVPDHGRLHGLVRT